MTWSHPDKKPIGKDYAEARELTEPANIITALWQRLGAAEKERDHWQRRFDEACSCTKTAQDDLQCVKAELATLRAERARREGEWAKIREKWDTRLWSVLNYVGAVEPYITRRAAQDWMADIDRLGAPVSAPTVSAEEKS